MIKNMKKKRNILVRDTNRHHLVTLVYFNQLLIPFKVMQKKEETQAFIHTHNLGVLPNFMFCALSNEEILYD